MGHDDGQEHRASRLVRKFGTVAAAAAALLGEGTATAHDGGVIADLWLQNDPASVVSRGAAEPAGDVPPPLILTPSHTDPDWLLARHRSHSSHSSHRSHSSHSSGSYHSSHYSASSHTSHYSSSRGTWAWPRIEPTRSPPTPSPAPAPRQSARNPQAGPPANPPPAPRVEAPPAIDRHDPPQRYELVTLGTYQGTQKAYIKDLLEGNASLLKVGESIGDCTVVEIVPQRDSVRLRPAQGEEFSIQRGRVRK